MSKQWSFDAPELDFEHHVREQLPWYDVATELTANIAAHFIGERGRVYDIGASTGNMSRAIQATIPDRSVEYLSVEPAEHLARQWTGPGRLFTESAENITFAKFDVAVCFLTLMFMHPEDASELVEHLIDECRPGGAILCVERTHPVSPSLGVATARAILAAKIRAGVPPEEIVGKEISLTGVQRPLAQEVFTSRGGVEFFRYGDFSGWVIEG